MNNHKRLLFIEDDPDVAELLLTYFDGSDYELLHAETGQRGVEYARTRFPHLILLDVMLPDIDGYEVCRTIRETSFTRYIPVIFLTQRDERANKVRGLELGADDYITKPFDMEELSLRVHGAIKRATRDSLHEPRSGLPTGRLIVEETERRVYQEEPFTRLCFTLDHFDAYREVYGFVAADSVFGFVGRALQESISKHGTQNDFVGVVDDHFVVLTHADDVECLIHAAQRRFSEGIKPFYTFADVDQGGMMLAGDNGVRTLVPLMALLAE